MKIPQPIKCGDYVYRRTGHCRLIGLVTRVGLTPNKVIVEYKVVLPFREKANNSAWLPAKCVLPYSLKINGMDFIVPIAHETLKFFEMFFGD